MGKFTAIQTYDRFLRLWEQNEVNDRSLNFILDTGQLYTHGIFLNSVAYGTEANGAVLLTIAGTQKTLSLSNHTHSTYLEKNANIDLGSYKIVSGQKDLLYYSGGNTYLGNTTSPAVILGTSLSTVRSDTTYTVLDTGNFSIGNTTTAGYTLLNVAVFKYGSNSFQLDYVKRVNTSSTFDALAAYTSAGTTQVNNKLYGVITLYTDGTILSPSWAQFRVDIADQLVLFRTSKDSTEWINLNQIEVPLNALNVAGSVAAPTSADVNKVWKTDGSGNPAWRADSGNTWRNIRINDEESDSLDTGTGTGALYIKQGTGITVSWSGNKIVIANSAPDTWKAANSLQEGYVPKLDGSGTISTQASEYVLTYTSGSGTITPTWKLLPANAFKDTTYSVTDTTGISLSGTTLSLNVGTRDTTNASSAATYVLNRFYQIVTDKDKKLGVVVPWSEGSNTTAIKQAAVTGTKKDDDTLITSDSGLIIQGGTNLIKIGDGTNYIEVPITPSITNNVTGTGTNGKLAKWSGDHTLTDGPGFSNAITTLSLSTKFLREDGTWAAPSYTSSLTFYNLIFKKSDDTTLMTYLPTTSPSKILKLGSGIGFDLSGDILTISASDTKYYLTLNGTANGNSGTTNLGTIYAPTTSGTGFLKCTVNNGIVTWSYDNSTYNNYELPTATASALGGIIISNALNTAVTLTSGNGNTADRYYGVQVDKDGKAFVNIPWINTWKQNTATLEGYVTAPGENVSGKVWMTGNDGTPSWLDANNHTHAYLPTANISPAISDGTDSNTVKITVGGVDSSNYTIPYATNTGKLNNYLETAFFRSRGTIAVEYVDLTTYTADATNYQNPLNGIYTVSRSKYSGGFIAFTGTGSTSGLDIYFEYSRGSAFKFRRRIDGNRLSGEWETILTDVNCKTYCADSELYVGGSGDLTANAAKSNNGEVYLTLKEGGTYYKHNIVGSGRASVTCDASGNITINSSGYSNFGVATALAAGTSGLVPAPGVNELGSEGYFLRADGTWKKPTDINTWRGIYIDGTSKLGIETTTKPINFKAAGGITLTFTAAGTNDAYNTLEVKSVTYSNFVKSGTNHAAGLVPDPGSTEGSTKFLREDGTWQVPSYTSLPTFYNLVFNNGTSDVLTYDPDGSASKTIKKGDYISFTVSDNVLTISSLDTWIAWAGATSSNGGTAGYMPAPGTANYLKFLRGDGLWCSLSTPDFTTTLTRATGNLTKDTWSDVGTFGDSVTAGTYIVNFTYDSIVYSGVFSYSASTDILAEEIALHAAGTGSKRLYARISGKKFLIASNETTFSMSQTTFNFRKLL